MSKGSGRRPSSLTQEEWDNRWDAIFGRDEPKPKVKVVFAPGCFDDFDGTQDELNAFVAEINQMAQDGTIMDGAKIMSEEEIEALKAEMAKKEPRQ